MFKPFNKPVSKREALSAVQEVAEFARKAHIAFSDLHTRCGLMEVEIKYNSNDPISEDQVARFEQLADEWEAVAKDILQ